VVVDGAILASYCPTRKKKVITWFVFYDIGELESSSFRDCAGLVKCYYGSHWADRLKFLADRPSPWGRLEPGAPDARPPIYASLNQMMVEAAGVEPASEIAVSRESPCCVRFD
jgi:hypothetical protein